MTKYGRLRALHKTLKKVAIATERQKKINQSNKKFLDNKNGH